MANGNASELHAVPTDLANIPSSRILVVGDITRWNGAGRETIAFSDFVFCNIAGLRSNLLHDLNPDIVLSPLIADDFDVIEVAIILRHLDFSGVYRVISTDIPKPTIILSEVKKVAPDLNFDLLVLPPELATKA